MKAVEFAKLMRKVIREEVRAAVKDELKEIKSILAESKQPKTFKNELVQKKTIKPSKPAPEHIQKMQGPLADILQETYQSMLHEEPIDDPEAAWPDMNNTLTSEMAPAMRPGLFQSPSPTSYGDGTEAFMKDYSSLMKKADAIANRTNQF